MSHRFLAPLCALLVAACLLAGCDSAPEQVQQTEAPVVATTPQPKPEPQPEKRKPLIDRSKKTSAAPQKPKKVSAMVLKLAILQDILTDYRKNHTYMGNDLYMCADMAMDVWNIVRTKGFNAKLAGGNPDRDIMASTTSYLEGMSHAWVMAQVSPKDWIAMECTGGFLVPKKEKPLYYSSAIFFSNPAELKTFMANTENARNSCQEYNELATGWNKLVAGKRYKPGSAQGQQYSYIEGNMNAKKRDCEYYTQQLQLAILTKRKL
ncbi:hypothetical protein [Desulfovibrio ferrophilus]|uniref:Lipoprotein n=1 Tax=Desulfovibrio ferrophilus TaxID=241368 RepID=A0A2Z6B1U4_9BACT|nr:hypothetical protein [Desulfovibrio ferrophilus]BBD09464.1 uncharacterized protein DFE_2738 [Desulfovibrio ferrophilus]